MIKAKSAYFILKTEPSNLNDANVNRWTESRRVLKIFKVYTNSPYKKNVFFTIIVICASSLKNFL